MSDNFRTLENYPKKLNFRSFENMMFCRFLISIGANPSSKKLFANLRFHFEKHFGPCRITSTIFCEVNSIRTHYWLIE